MTVYRESEDPEFQLADENDRHILSNIKTALYNRLQNESASDAKVILDCLKTKTSDRVELSSFLFHAVFQSNSEYYYKAYSGEHTDRVWVEVFKIYDKVNDISPEYLETVNQFDRFANTVIYGVKRAIVGNGVNDLFPSIRYTF